MESIFFWNPWFEHGAKKIHKEWQRWKEDEWWWQGIQQKTSKKSIQIVRQISTNDEAAWFTSSGSITCVCVWFLLASHSLNDPFCRGVPWVHYRMPGPDPTPLFSRRMQFYIGFWRSNLMSCERVAPKLAIYHPLDILYKMGGLKAITKHSFCSKPNFFWGGYAFPKTLRTAFCKESQNGVSHNIL